LRESYRVTVPLLYEALKIDKQEMPYTALKALEYAATGIDKVGWFYPLQAEKLVPTKTPPLDRAALIVQRDLLKTQLQKIDEDAQAHCEKQVAGYTKAQRMLKSARAAVNDVKRTAPHSALYKRHKHALGVAMQTFARLCRELSALGLMHPTLRFWTGLCEGRDQEHLPVVQSDRFTKRVKKAIQLTNFTGQPPTSITLLSDMQAWTTPARATQPHNQLYRERDALRAAVAAAAAAGAEAAGAPPVTPARPARTTPVEVSSLFQLKF